jgi:hypothetical protein
MCEFCHAYFNGLLWQQITFNTYVLPEKSTDNLQSYFCANGQLLALITKGQVATDNFQRLVQPIQWTDSTEVTFLK